MRFLTSVLLTGSLLAFLVCDLSTFGIPQAAQSVFKPHSSTIVQSRYGTNRTFHRGSGRRGMMQVYFHPVAV